MSYKLLKSEITSDIKSKYETMLTLTPENTFSSKYHIQLGDIFHQQSKH